MVYVMSDIHGQFGLFKKMLKTINFTNDDTLYIIGDVIDRGPQSIDMMLFIMKFSNITCLMGNHEYMMYKAYAFGEDFMLWLSNGGTTTMEQYEDLPDNLKECILDYIENMPIVVPRITVNNKDYYLIHSSPIDIEDDEIKTIKDLNSIDIHAALWDRNYPFSEVRYFNSFEKRKHQTVIAGHSISPLVNSHRETCLFRGCKGHYINIDCGCARIPFEKMHKMNGLGRLCCLRLDDLKYFYVR